MVNQRFDQEELHASHRGSHGNSLHLAAAKGDRELVDALLDIGCDPCKRCDQRAFTRDISTSSNISVSVRSGRIKSGYDGEGANMWLPEDWARVRGHSRVVRLLTRRRKQLQLQQQQVRTVLSGSTNTSNEQTADYDTITANDNDTLTADYDSNSSCSSDYDSDYDSEDDSDSSTFEDGRTFDEDATFDSSEFDSDEEPSLLSNIEKGINRVLPTMK